MDYKNYKDILSEEYEKRVKVNPSYSLRAFASKLEMSPSRISEILNNKQGLSPKTAKKISQKLNFDANKAKLFELLVNSSYAKSETQKKISQDELSKFKNYLIKEIPIDQYELMCGWQYYTLLELFKTSDVVHSIPWLSKKLGLSEDVIKKSIDRLKRLRMLRFEKGKYIVVDTNPFSTISYTPSDALKQHHMEVIKKSQIALYDQDLNSREYNSLIIAIHENDIPSIRKKIRDFYNALNIEYSDPKRENTKVYAFSSQFFDLLN